MTPDEKAIQIVYEWGGWISTIDGKPSTITAAISSALRHARLEAIEECAAKADWFGFTESDGRAYTIAAAIRARKETT